MPPFLLTPLMKWTLLAAAGAAAVQWVVKEARRVNEELDMRRVRIRIRENEPRPTLRRDPNTGEYRL
jgi:ribosome-associated protein YbcJ (S4-like RNA binding protein)